VSERNRHVGSSEARSVARVVIALGLLVGALAAGAQTSSAPSSRLLDRFADLTPWHAAASDGARASVEAAQGDGDSAMRLDFDLAGTAGYALAYRALPLDLPANYEISFWLRADAPVNNLQVKLVDASGDNVWWFSRQNFEFPRDWREIRIKKRQIEFAWGPSTNRVLTHAARVEFVVAAGRGGGSGSVYVSRLALRELPAQPSRWPQPVAQASSHATGSEASLALDGNRASAWRSDPSAGAEQSVTVDLGATREFGGLILRWAPAAFASRYDVQFSDDGRDWVTVRSVRDGHGGPDAMALPDAEARFVRLALHAGPGRGYGLQEIEIMDPAFGESPNAFFSALARESPRGYYPRGFSGEQQYWTIVGVDGGSETALLSEDGALETASGGFSIEPFVVEDSRVVTWADVDIQQFLLDRYLPMPGVTWQAARWDLRISAFASGPRAASNVVASYELQNRTASTLSLQLVLAVRPIQVNPPTQFLNNAGGVSAIRDIAYARSGLTINGAQRVFALARPDRVGAFDSDAGPVPQLIASRRWQRVESVHDASGYASGALGYDLVLPPHGRATIGIVAPLSGPAAPPDLKHQRPQQWIARERNAVAADWRAKLNRVTLRVPRGAQPLADTLRTAHAHMLVTRDGPILRPGTRAYARSWIRDGTMIAESLLRLGDASVAADYVRWYAGYQFADGKIPCCVDARGADPVPENDSAGEFIYLVAEIYRYTHGRALLETMWPHVEAAVRYLDMLRRSERDDVGQSAATRTFHGLLPASISHEGYAQKPMHSYWDDWWALKGYRAATAIAATLGHRAEADQFARERDAFAADVAASLRASAAAHGIAYLPGSAELGDFDPTSSAIAFAPGGEVEYVPQELVQPTYERYWRELSERGNGRLAWEEYTPYELRTVGTFVRLGERDRAQAALAFFLTGRRAAAWNQWAEVVGRDPRKPRFIGDMPHAWVASDFVRATLDLFAYERDTDHSLVLAAGIPSDWLSGDGIAVGNLSTPYGPLGYSLRKEHSQLVFHLNRGSAVPPGGFVLACAGANAARYIRVNGKEVTMRGAEIKLTEVPSTVVLGER